MMKWRHFHKNQKKNSKKKKEEKSNYMLIPSNPPKIWGLRKFKVKKIKTEKDMPGKYPEKAGVTLIFNFLDITAARHAVIWDYSPNKLHC